MHIISVCCVSGICLLLSNTIPQKYLWAMTARIIWCCIMGFYVLAASIQTSSAAKANTDTFVYLGFMFFSECFSSPWKVCLSSRKTKHTFPNKQCGQILAEDNAYCYKKSSAPKKASARGSADDKDQKNMRNAHNSFDDMLPWQRRNFSGSDWTIYHLERTTICKCWYSLYRLLPTVEFLAVGVICLHGVVKTFKRPLDYGH